MEIGETGKYFNKKLKKNIYSDLLIFPGYRVNFLLAENGLHLRVDSTFKLVQTTTVLNFIDDIYRENQHR